MGVPQKFWKMIRFLTTLLLCPAQVLEQVLNLLN